MLEIETEENTASLVPLNSCFIFMKRNTVLEFFPPKKEK